MALVFALCAMSYGLGGLSVILCVMWAVFYGSTGNIIPHFGFGQEHPGEE